MLVWHESLVRHSLFFKIKRKFLSFLFCVIQCFTKLLQYLTSKIKTEYSLSFFSVAILNGRYIDKLLLDFLPFLMTRLTIKTADSSSIRIWIISLNWDSGLTVVLFYLITISWITVLWCVISVMFIRTENWIGDPNSNSLLVYYCLNFHTNSLLQRHKSISSLPTVPWNRWLCS